MPITKYPFICYLVLIIDVISFSLQVDMPVFFYIDPDIDDDPAMAKVDTITLSYTFFESKEGMELPQPLTAAA